MREFIDKALTALLGISFLAFVFGGVIAAAGPPDDPATRIAVWVAMAGALVMLPLLVYDEWGR